MIRSSIRSLPSLKELETETIYIIREAYILADKACMVLWNTRNSIVLSHLIRKAFFPQNIPFPFISINTGTHHPEDITFRNVWPAKLGATLILGKSKKEETSATPGEMLNTLIAGHNFTTIFECSLRASQPLGQPGFVSTHRNESYSLKPEVWNMIQAYDQQNLCNIYPLSNWTELDVCLYLYRENIMLSANLSSQGGRISIENGIISLKEKMI